MSRVLAIGDIHEPVCRKGYLEFCQDIYEQWDCNKVVFIGDVVDWHAISFHAQHPEAPSSGNEYQLALDGVQKWRKAFPVADVCIGNHDERVIRLAETVNIPARFIRNYSDIWETPNWNWTFDTIIDGVYYFHGVGYGGLHPAFNAARQMSMSVVMGHIHSTAGVKYLANPNKLWFGMDTGCGIDDKQFAFAYGKHTKKRSILGCGVVLEGTYAIWEPMVL